MFTSSFSSRFYLSFYRFYSQINNIEKRILLAPDAPNRFVMLLSNVLNKDECNNWINKTEQQGYTKALVNIGNGKEKLIEGIRNSERCIIDNKEMSLLIFNRIKQYLPNEWKGYKLSCLNERLRFLKYSNGQVFKPHYDGSFKRSCETEQSFITLQLYLNEGYNGGSTKLIGKTEKLEIIPKTGSILLFEHHVLHESSPLINGIKYACRTDVMYSLKH